MCLDHELFLLARQFQRSLRRLEDRHVHHELAVIVACLAQQTAKFTQKRTIFSRATPSVFVIRLALGKFW